ncbi:MAG TPA: signal peptidase I [Bacillus bacterium]|nr:signal peptidase I [Bacillus sp. (in: firmicutes)]
MKVSTKKEFISWLQSILYAFIIVFVAQQFFISPITVKGESMVPTFQDKDKLLISKISEIERFDIIVFDAPDADRKYIKRVIGLPGDRIEVKDDVLYINGEAIEEQYIMENREELSFGKLMRDFTLEDLTGEATVPDNSLFVMGDNRRISKDSRIFGFISYDSVRGKVKFQIYPFQEIGMPR